MIGDVCLDKDGVRAAAVFAEMANYNSVKYGRNVQEQLNYLYEQ